MVFIYISMTANKTADLFRSFARVTVDLTALPSSDSRHSSGQDHSSYLQIWIVTGKVDEAMQFDVVWWYRAGIGISAQCKSLK